MSKFCEKRKKTRIRSSRKKQALTTLCWLLLLLALSFVLNIWNFTENQAVREAERRKGWPAMRLIWEQEEITTWRTKEKVQLYVYENTCVFAEMTWDLMSGWSCQFMSVVEPAEDRPVQSAQIWFHGRKRMYVVGSISDDRVALEDITYRICWQLDDEKESFSPDVKSTVRDGGRTYFVHKVDYSHRVTDEEQNHWGLYVSVREKNGSPIVWEDGCAEDFGDWMRVTNGYFTSR